MYKMTWERCTDDRGELIMDNVRIVLSTNIPQRIVSIAESKVWDVQDAIHAVVCDVPAPQRNQIFPAFDTGELDSAEYIQAVWAHGLNMKDTDEIFKNGGSI